MFTGETSKHPELDPLGIGFDRMLKFARVAKIFEKNIGGCKLAPPAADRGLIEPSMMKSSQLSITEVELFSLYTYIISVLHY